MSFVDGPTATQVCVIIGWNRFETYSTDINPARLLDCACRHDQHRVTRQTRGQRVEVHCCLIEADGFERNTNQTRCHLHVPKRSA
jgi:hypothetical protein